MFKENLRLGVIGTGKVGSALGLWALNAGYQVTWGARNKERARQLVETGGDNAGSGDVAHVIQENNFIIMAVPYSVVPDILKEAGSVAGKVMVDVTNPLNHEHTALTVGQTTSGAEEIAHLAPQARWVKAFNAVFAEVYEAETPYIADHRVSVLYAGDCPDAKETVRELIFRLGFDAVDAGPLQSSRLLEPLSMLNITLGRQQRLGTHIGFTVLR